MKIAMLIPEFPGQTHSFFWREIRALQSGYDVDVAIYSTRLPEKPAAHEWVKDAKASYLFPVKPADGFGVMGRLFAGIIGVLKDKDSRAILRNPRNLAFLVIAAKLVRMCRADAIDHIHVHSCANAALVAALCRKLGGPTYSLTLHGALRDYGDFQHYKWSNAQHVLTVSETLKREVAEVLPDIAPRIEIAPMGVDTEVFAPLADTDTPGTPFRFFLCARLNEGKGYATLLAAATEVAKTHDFIIEVAGEDEEQGRGYRLEIEEGIKAAGLEDRIVLRGSLPQAEVLAHLQNADAFVLPSYHEALGVSYMEAMACALPTIGSRTGGVPELIEDGVSGLLVDPKDADGLAQAMRQLMDDPALCARLGPAGRAVVVARYSSRRSADKLAELLGLS